jgi:asparagine synthase (glutamine-hydrolysing)
MCGITGVLHRKPNYTEAELLAVVADMTTTLTHRGPDASGCWANPEQGIALGHRRLSIQDLTSAGAQPMASASGRYMLCYNGEIYNYPKLSRELANSGFHFRGHSDTEVILASVEHWGISAALEKFQGMFAFALWDRQDNSLVLARDRAGKKPLYYGWCADTFLFGSELKALRAHPDFNASIDRRALAAFIQYAWVPGPHSIFEGISKLPPGHWLRLSADGSEQIHCYWSAADVAHSGERQPFSGTLSQATDALDDLLQDAVNSRMLADVKLGALLSGGYDSTTITALMQHASAVPVKTFTIGFTEADYDESGFARDISSHLRTDHTELFVSADDARELIPQLPAMYDEPFADASQMPTHIVSKLAREHVTVALSGDGGDELFAGYGRYRRPQRDLARWSGLPRPLRPTLARLLGAGCRLGWQVLQPGDSSAKMPGWRRFPAKLDKNIDALLVENEVELFARQRSRVPNGADYVANTPGFEPQLNDVAAAATLAEPRQGMMLLDFTNYLVDDILVKVDRASMATSLEVRAPFLDHRVVELAWSLPLEMRYDNSGGKRVLRELLSRYVPRQLTDRPKMGFGVPVAEWLRGSLRPWAEELLDPRRLAQDGLLNPEAVARIWKQHQCGWRDHSDVLWSILMFQAWLDAG